MPAFQRNVLSQSSALNKEAACFSRTSISTCQFARRYNTEDNCYHLHRHENTSSYSAQYLFNQTKYQQIFQIEPNIAMRSISCLKQCNLYHEAFLKNNYVRFKLHVNSDVHSCDTKKALLFQNVMFKLEIKLHRNLNMIAF
jgi:hypothetical protein